MAIAFYFNPPSKMSADQYDKVTRELEEAGQGAPEGRLYHSAFGEPDGIQVFDVWDSMESFERFGQTLMPILASNGVDVGEPMAAPVHNLISG